jgi:hypothetical protein
VLEHGAQYQHAPFIGCVEQAQKFAGGFVASFAPCGLDCLGWQFVAGIDRINARLGMAVIHGAASSFRAKASV